MNTHNAWDKKMLEQIGPHTGTNIFAGTSVSMVVLCTPTVNGDSANVTLATKRPGESAEW